MVIDHLLGMILQVELGMIPGKPQSSPLSTKVTLTNFTRPETNRAPENRPPPIGK